MDCPVCGKKLRVNHTEDEGQRVIRTRKCGSCGFKDDSIETFPHHEEKNTPVTTCNN